MDKIKWIIATVIFLILIALAMFSGYHLKKCPECPEIQTKDSTYTIPAPPQTAHLEIKKPATPIYSDSGMFDNSGDSCGVTSPKYYNQTTDTTIVFKNDSLKTVDSLDYVLDVTFDTETKTFTIITNFVLRTTEKIKEVVKEVLVPMKPEIYQEPLVIGLIAAVMFLFGLAF